MTFDGVHVPVKINSSSRHVFSMQIPKTILGVQISMKRLLPEFPSIVVRHCILLSFA